MKGEPVFEQACTMLLERLREALVPAVLHGADDVQMVFPNQGRDARVGLSLYNIEEVRPYGPPGWVPVGDQARRGPSRCFALHILVFANRKAPFDSMTATDELILLEAVLRAIHNGKLMELEGEQIKVEFDSLSQQDKTALWQSLGCSLQPAVYLMLEPLVVPNTRLEQLIPVREVRVKSKKMEGAGGV